MNNIQPILGFSFYAFPCAHSMLFWMKVHFLVFSVLLCFSLYLTNSFLQLFYFFITIF